MHIVHRFHASNRYLIFFIFYPQLQQLTVTQDNYYSISTNQGNSHTNTNTNTNTNTTPPHRCTLCKGQQNTYWQFTLNNLFEECWRNWIEQNLPVERKSMSRDSNFSHFLSPFCVKFQQKTVNAGAEECDLMEYQIFGGFSNSQIQKAQQDLSMQHAPLQARR